MFSFDKSNRRSNVEASRTAVGSWSQWWVLGQFLVWWPRSMHNVSTESGFFYNNMQDIARSKDTTPPRVNEACVSLTTPSVWSQHHTVTNSKENIIVLFLQSLAERCSDCMLGYGEQHLQFQKKWDLYKRCVSQFWDPPSIAYFLHVWKHRGRNVKVKKTGPFARFSLRAQLYVALKAQLTDSWTELH